jgi:hypothetical protein
MKKPSLRFRQVFEHSTHFKVTKPLGNPLIIAKKGLSPSLQGRLRKFAQGGEVRGYDNGGEVADPSVVDPAPLADLLGPNLEPVEPLFDVATPNLAPSLTYQDRLARSMIPAPTADLEMGFTSRGQAVTDPGLTIGPRLTEAAPPDGADVFRPRGSIASAPQTPDVKLPKIAQTPDQVSFVGFGEPKEELELDESGLDTSTEPAADEQQVSAAQEPVEPAKPTALQTELAKIGLTEEQFNTLPPVQKAAAMSVVRTSIAASQQAEADRVAAEAEVQRLSDEAEERKKEFALLKLRADETRETQKKILQEYDHVLNPETYFSKPSTLDQIGTAVALALGGFASGLSRTPNVVLQMINSATEADLARQKQAADSLYRRLVDVGHTADAAEELVRAQMKMISAAEFNRQAATTKLPQVRAKIEIESAKLVGDAIRSYAQVAKDERAGQIMEKEAPLNLRVLEDRTKEAEERRAGRSFRLRSLAAQAISDELKPAQIRQAMKNDADRLNLDREKAEAAREDRLAVAKDKEEQDRISRELEVGDATLELKDKTRGSVIRDEMSNREQGLMSAMKLNALLKKGGLEVFSPTSDVRGEAIAELNLLMETFPKTQAFKRAISVNAKQVLEKAFQDPTGYKALFKELFMGRDPSVGVGAMLQEGKRSYANAVRSQVRDAKDPKVEAAIQSFFIRADKEIEKYEKGSLPNSDLFEAEN